MKKIFTYCIIAVVAVLSSFVPADDVINAIKSGSASQLSKYFDNTIDITLPDKTNAYSKSQGELVLKDFFDNNVVKDFEVIHKGENAGAQFIIGTLNTKNGEYRTTIYMKQKGDRQLLQELRFEK
jgi:chemotaxis protein CheY-P-specific phosphatase CheC